MSASIVAVLLTAACGRTLTWLPDRETGHMAHIDVSTEDHRRLDFLPLHYLPEEFHTFSDQRKNQTVGGLNWLQTSPYWTEFDIYHQKAPNNNSHYDIITCFSIQFETISPDAKIQARVMAQIDHFRLIDYDALLRLRPKRLKSVSRRVFRRAMQQLKYDIEDTVGSYSKNPYALSSQAILKHSLGLSLTMLLARTFCEFLYQHKDIWAHVIVFVLCALWAEYAKIPKSAITLLLFVKALPWVVAAKDDDSGNAAHRCPIFEGITANFVSWFISFTAWVAWKAPELVPILNGTQPLPAAADPAHPTAAEKKKIREWELNNTQLYGAVVSHVAAPIQSSLHVQANGDGFGAVTYLKQRYGSQSTGDRAEATARLQKSYIDPRAKLSESDIVRQYNEMSLAAADIIAAGGAKPDDELLISMFENALPTAYAMIRQMVRYSKHTSFEQYYNDFLSQVKAEERAMSLNNAPAAFSTTQSSGHGDARAFGYKGGRGKGNGKGGRGMGRGDYPTNPCFNCGRLDHPRFRCPQRQRTTCKYCGSNHIDELCPRGPGGSLRDSLSDSAKGLLDKQANGRGPNNRTGAETSQAYVAQQQHTDQRDWLHQEYQAYLSRKRTSAPDQTDHSAKRARTGPSPKHACTQLAAGGSRASFSQSPTADTQSNAHTASSTSNIYHELDEFFDNLRPHAHFVDSDRAYASAVNAKKLHHMAFIDSQATNFVVPSVDYLTGVTDAAPRVIIDTANGSVKPECIGETTIQLLNDDGQWFSFHIEGVWVLPGCDRILYSQAAMSRLGVIHRLDEGYIILPDGSRKSVSVPTYTMEVSFPTQSAHVASSLSIPMPPNIASSSSSLNRIKTRSNVTVPQQLIWQRLGFPSKQIWLRIQDVLKDHGLPEAAHLKHDFPIPEAVARSRARAKPFHDMRDPDHLPAPGAVVYMDFAGSMTPSYPHGYRYYCGAVDAGSGYTRVVPCHHPTKEVAKQCVELLLADLRQMMGLSHKLRPQVVVSDQGSQFVSHYFRDFLSEEQIRHWPSTVYTPQQNAIVERMWGTRFGIARTLMKFANLGPAWHPFGIQCANWICNRLPQSSRANMSPCFILSRLPASIGYLKSFGCLVRMTIPLERRQGDRHFADRGVLGVYLGPSEQSPGCIVYIPSMRKFFVTRDVICYEDVHPGIRQVDAKWIELEEGRISNGTSLELLSSQPDDTVVMQHPASTDPLRMETRESLDQQVPIGPDIDDPDGSGAEHLEMSGQIVNADCNYDDLAISNDADHGTAPDAIDHDEGSPHNRPTDPTLDPKSKMFRRVLPERSTRYRGAYACKYTDPSLNTPIQAIANTINLNGSALLTRTDLIAYESCVGALNRVYVVTTTNEFGQVQIPRGYNHSLRVPEAHYWREAIAKEYSGLLAIGTFEFVKRSDVPATANIMRCHLVFALKRNEDGSIDKFKARLVADGNTQRYGVDFDRVFSTVAKLSTLRIVLVIAAAYDFNLSSIDIRQAYLQATLAEELYMQMPPGMPDTDEEGNSLVVRLKRSLYGLKQAGREWHVLLTGTLKAWGFSQSSIDVCLFTYSRGDSQLVIVVWVDDCVIMDNDPTLRAEFVIWLSEKFPVEDKGELHWILHVKVARDRQQRTLSLSQELYIGDLLSKYDYLLDGLTRRFDSPHDASVSLTPEQSPAIDSTDYENMNRHRDDYMSLVGAFLWLANVSRPELAYISGQLARFVSNPGKAHYKAALRVLVYLRGTSSQSLMFKPSGSKRLRPFVDADWAVKFSVSGGIIEFMGCVIHWLSRSQRSVSMSSTEAEYFAACVIAREVLYFRELLMDLGHMQSGPTTLLTDNKGVVALSFDPIAFKKTKHILRAAEFVRDLAVKQMIKLQWIAGKDNVADICTKPVALVIFRSLMSLMTRLCDLG